MNSNNISKVEAVRHLFTKFLFVFIIVGCNKIKSKVEKIWNCKERLTFNSAMKITQAELSALRGFLPVEYQDCKWRLLFRASEHHFKASKFHKYLPNKLLKILMSFRKKILKERIKMLADVKWTWSANFDDI